MLGTARKLPLTITRFLNPTSKLATACAIHSDTLEHTLGYGVDDADENGLYSAMDYLVE